MTKIMKKIICAGAIFYDSKHRLLLEDRRRISKHGEHWSFFGGHVEKGETIKQALLREIKEELSHHLVNYTFFRKYDFYVNSKKFGRVNMIYHMYIAKMPDLSKLKPHKGAGMKLFSIKQAMKLRTTQIDKKIFRDVERLLYSAI